ncbi:isoprenylcysteine carboxyl methyltransferase [Paenalkalicoccus suaedae]|uniref:Isoprenylcysteine carboxyl methyltransferase n=1 Tax=Paenalkalicoccus suaedae TaxID=2592382 RepID=A0A859FBJ2_9BACI|nr:isoprenylcysteine carboxylmethyltransferase family protein [Paenalkalicoccus suaedae]QKS70407.1 isoprenylcysteine carboxyl methyltransferase [Paenalkalicoccus suaedae]
MIILLVFIVIQRLLELVLAKRNERSLKAKGAVEFGKRHYPLMIALHAGFFLSLAAEWLTGAGELHAYSAVLLVAFFLLQFIRVWILYSLGDHWNTKVLVIPGAPLIKRGPYKYWLKHPNYVVVMAEMFVLVLLFQAYFTGVVFLLFKLLFLTYIRIPLEEQALRWSRE